MARDAEQAVHSQYEWAQGESPGLTTTGSKLRSCLSSGRHSDSAIPAASAARAAAHLSEHKGLHWKPELVAVSAADQRTENRELQARYLKLEADLQESEAAKALLQKQLHRVQEAMKQNRDDLENAQRSALTAQESAAAAEAKAASLAAEVRVSHHRSNWSNVMRLPLQCAEELLSTHQHHHSPLQVAHLQTELEKGIQGRNASTTSSTLEQVCRQA